MEKNTWTLLGSAGLGAGLGAGLMYLLDPQGGGRRRALARDKTVHVLHKGGDAVRKTSRHLGNRTKGLIAEAGSRLRRAGEVDDQVLCDRVRSKLGRCVSHASALEVAAEDGRVTLTGPVLASEVDKLLAKVRKIKGVADVEDHLEVHEEAGDHPALQGNGRSAWQFVQENWQPATRVLAGTAGAGLALAGLKRRDKLGAALSAVGLTLLAGGLTGLTNGGNGRLSDRLGWWSGQGAPAGETPETGASPAS
jgi:hypothetical protein